MPNIANKPIMRHYAKCLGAVTNTLAYLKQSEIIVIIFLTFGTPNTLAYFSKP